MSSPVPAVRAACAVALTAVLACRVSPAGVDPEPPNVIVVFTDDQGWGDVGVQGADGFSTPNFDRLAAEGIRFSDFYVAQPVCSASRAALLTGCYPNRIGIHGALGPSSKKGIADGETTLGELFQSRGYATAAFGKWHLGWQPEFSPLRHGFDEFYGIPYSNDMWPFHPEGGDPWRDLPTIDGERVVGFNTDQRRFTEDITRRSEDFVRRSVEEGRRFFLYVAHPMPHVPLHVSEPFRGTSEQGLLGDVLQEVDASLGRLMALVAELGVDRDTLIVFSSDNGPWLSYGHHAGSTGGLREGKGTTFEGGVRVPCAMRWPGRIGPGRVSAEPVMTIDVFPTLAHLIGAELPDGPIDGENIWPLIEGSPGARSPHEALWFYYGVNELQALRAGPYKLHLPHRYRSMEGRELGRDGQPGSYDYGRETGLELYDLTRDPGEQHDLSDAQPEILARLAALAEQARADLGDALTGRVGTGLRAAGSSDAPPPERESPSGSDAR